MIATANWAPIIFFRWLHVVCACLLLGGAFLLALIMPKWTAGAGPADPGYVRSRRRFKMVVHTAILLSIASGVYNAMGNWAAYKGNVLTHELFGPHLLFAAVTFAILLMVLARKEPRPSERVWMWYAAALLLLTVLAASALKYAREHPPQHTTSYSIGYGIRSGRTR